MLLLAWLKRSFCVVEEMLLFSRGRGKKGSISSACESSTWPNRVMFTADVAKASTIWAWGPDADGNTTVTENVGNVCLLQERGALPELRYSY